LQLLLNNKVLAQQHLKEQITELFGIIEIESKQLIKF